MTAPVRLLDGAADTYTRDLLESAVVLDEPNDAALDRVLTTVASGAVLGAVTVATHAGATSSVAAASSALAAESLAVSGKASVITIVVKWVGIGAVGGLATAGGAHYLAATATPDRGEPQHVATSPRPQRTPAAAVSARVGGMAVAKEGVADENTVSEPKPPDPALDLRQAPGATLRKPTASAARSQPSATAANPLAVEVAALDRARRALNHGDTGAALEALDAYAVARKTGVLDREAMIVRIDALVSRGDKARAVALARRYLARFPSDPHTQRLRDLIASQ